jgi:cyclopropane-fatty-acyl-phospholipid synthase
LREHYSLTLENWARNLESNSERAIESSSEVIYRTWLIYLHACIHRFKKGRYNVYQSLLVKPDKGKSGFPLTRSDLYIQ